MRQRVESRVIISEALNEMLNLERAEWFDHCLELDELCMHCHGRHWWVCPCEQRESECEYIAFLLNMGDLNKLHSLSYIVDHLLDIDELWDDG